MGPSEGKASANRFPCACASPVSRVFNREAANELGRCYTASGAAWAEPVTKAQEQKTRLRRPEYRQSQPRQRLGSNVPMIHMNGWSYAWASWENSDTVTKDLNRSRA